MSLKPFKIVGRLVAARVDEEGNVVDEISVGELTLYAPQFSQLAEQVELAWPGVVQEHGGVSGDTSP